MEDKTLSDFHVSVQMFTQNAWKLEKLQLWRFTWDTYLHVCKNTVKKVVGRPGADSESWRSVLGGAEEMQRCYNVSNLLSTLISTQRKKKKPRGELGQRNDEEDRVGGVIVPNNRYSPTYSGGNRSGKIGSCAKKKILLLFLLLLWDFKGIMGYLCRVTHTCDLQSLYPDSQSTDRDMFF